MSFQQLVSGALAVPNMTDENDKWDRMADELVELVAAYIEPGTLEPSPWLSRPLREVSAYYAQQSRGAAHWMCLSKALFRRAQRCEWQAEVRRNRQSRIETAACCRILECHNEAHYDCAPHSLDLAWRPFLPARRPPTLNSLRS